MKEKIHLNEGQKIKLLRKRLIDVTQGSLAQRANIPQAKLCFIEQGMIPKKEVLAKLHSILEEIRIEQVSTYGEF